MRFATAISFPSEAHVPVEEPGRWVICLESKCPTLDPIHAVLRQRGRSARSIRLDPEPEPSAEKATTRREPLAATALRRLLDKRPPARRRWIFFGARE